MTKFTIVTDRRGKLIGAVQGHDLFEKFEEVEAHVSFAPGHKLHQVDADIDMSTIADPKEFEKYLPDLFQSRAGRLRPEVEEEIVEGEDSDLPNPDKLLTGMSGRFELGGQALPDRRHRTNAARCRLPFAPPKSITMPDCLQRVR
jgi:hypothetical protein